MGTQGHFEYCRAIQAAVSADVQAHRKILVAHGAAFQIRAGDTEVPMDRANSLLELKKAGMTDLTGMQSRIKSRYYDRIYLTLADWYDPQVIAELNRQYRVESVIPAPPGKAMTPLGYQGLMEDCRIFVPR